MKVYATAYGDAAEQIERIQMPGHVCQVSMNPRLRSLDHCDCGNKVQAPPPEIRDTAYETTYLNEVAVQAAKRFGIQSDGFVIAVQRRLEMGQARYGNQFMELDLGREGAEEGLDGGAYAVLDTQKQMALGTEDTDERAFHMFEAAVHSAAATWHFQQARTV